MEKPLRVLIVEDDVFLNESLLFLVQLKGMKAVQAFDAQQALEIIRTEEIDVVISDVYMPGMSGIALLREIRRFTRSLPVIIMSGSVEPGIMQKAIKNGAIGFLAKPIDYELLISMLQSEKVSGKPKRRAIPSGRPPTSTLSSEGRSGDEYENLAKA